MLTASDDFLFPSVPGNGFQDELLYHLARDQGEAGWPALLWVLLAMFLKRGMTFAFLQSLSISQLPWSKVIKCNPAVTFASFLGFHGCHLRQEGSQHSCLLHILCNQVPTSFSTGPTFSAGCLLSPTYWKELLFFSIPGQIQFHLGFGFPNFTPQCSMSLHPPRLPILDSFVLQQKGSAIKINPFTP